MHLLITPKKHIKSLNEVLPDDQALIFHAMQTIPKLASEQGLHTGYRTILNTGPGGGQEIDHIHFHLLGGTNLPGFQ